jgi:hypothetical protein
LILISGFVLLAGLVIYGIFKQNNLSNRPRPAPVELSAQKIEPPEEVRPLIDELLANGFTRLGSSQLSFPDLDAIYTSSVFIDSNKATTASVSWGHPIDKRAVLTTVFEDETLLTTTYSGADPSLLDDGYLRFYEDNFTEAIAAHHQHVNELYVQHGPPILFGSIAERLAYFTKAGPRYSLDDARIFAKNSRNYLLDTGRSVVFDLIIMGSGFVFPAIILVGGYFAWVTSIKMWRNVFRLGWFYVQEMRKPSRS